MTSASDSQLLLVGLPEAGKTTFLAALWYMVNQSDVDCLLQLDYLDGESGYLNQIRDAWLEYRPVSRTLVDAQRTLTMHLKHRVSDQRVELTVPDLSGESYRLQWTKRELTQQYNLRLRKATGILLFVNPEHVNKAHRIEAADWLVAEINHGADKNPQSLKSDLMAATKTWDPETAPTQVQIIELLQVISSREYFIPPVRVTVIVSAWDRVASMGHNPAKWIESEMPMLGQFLVSNERAFEVAYYGLSAQGGRYASPQLLPENMANPLRFIDEMRKGASPLSTWIWSKFENQTRNSLSDGALTDEKAADILSKALNLLMSQPPIFDEALFQGITLSDETSEILSDTQIRPGDDYVRVNRLLLEDAYPANITKERRFAAEALELQKKKPSNRVLITGTNVGNPHDITEPVIWLMQ